jgi:DNA polymerase-3 subunit beta
MRCTVTKENFSQALASVSHLTSRTSALPILRNLLFQIESSGITLSATNLEVGIRAHLRGKVEEVGAVTVDARVLSEFVSNLPTGPVTLGGDGKGLTIRARGVDSTLKTLPADEFPVIPFPPKPETQELPGSELIQSLTQVSYAASGDDGRPELTGVFWQWKGNTLTLAATDSYRLAERTLRLPKAAPERSLILPAKLLNDLSRALPTDPGAITLGVTENQVAITTPEVEFVSRVIDGQFPEYQQIIPKTQTTTTELAVADLVRALKTASLFVRPGVNDTTLEVAPKTLSVSAANSQVGEGRTTLDAGVSGDPLTIVFNYRFLLDALATLPGDTAVLEFTSPANPAVIRSKGDQTLTALVMPIRA